MHCETVKSIPKPDNPYFYQRRGKRERETHTYGERERRERGERLNRVSVIGETDGQRHGRKS